MTNQPSVPCSADLLIFFFRFSFGDFLTDSGAAGVISDSSRLMMSTSASAAPTSICGVSASQTWGAIGIR
jgi:hypothetical protein